MSVQNLGPLLYFCIAASARLLHAVSHCGKDVRPNTGQELKKLKVNVRSDSHAL